METWINKDICKLSDEYNGRTIQFYSEKLFPGMLPGKGNERHYTKNDVCDILIALKLKRAGIQIGLIKTIIDGIRLDGYPRYYYHRPNDGSIEIVVHVDSIKSVLK